MTVNRILQHGAPHGTRAGYVDWRCGCFACRYWKMVQQRKHRGREVEPAQPVSFITIGDRVKHPHLGWGTVLEIEEHGRRLRVRHHNRRRTTSYRTAIIVGHRDRDNTVRFVARKLARQYGNHVTKLRPEQIAELRTLRAQGWYYRELAERFGVCEATASRYARGYDGRRAVEWLASLSDAARTST